MCDARGQQPVFDCVERYRVQDMIEPVKAVGEGY